MRISTKDWVKYINRLSELNRTASEEMTAWIQRNGFGNREALLDYAYALVTKYGEGSASLSAEMYDATMEMEGAFYPAAVPAPTATYDETAKAVNGTLKRSRNPFYVGATVGRLVKMAGADTTIKNAIRDGVEWAWIPHGDTCPFCITLASRGWQQASAAVLKGNHAEHIHSNCDCTFAIRSATDTTYDAYDPDRYLEMYENAEGNSWQEKVNSMRRIDYAANKEKINAQKRAAYAERVEKSEKDSIMSVRKKETFMAGEESLRTKNGGEFGVNWNIVKSKEYTERFNVLSDNAKANELAAQRARNALVNRDGKKTEELYAISLTTGKDVASITDQHYDFGVKRTEKFTADVNRALERGESILFIHNHPRGFPPSLTDINEIMNNNNSVGITVGHDGSIFYYSRANKKLEDFDYDVAYRKLPWYSGNEREDMLRALEVLSERYEFVLERL